MQGYYYDDLGADSPYDDDPDYEAWLEKEEARGELAGAPDTMLCYECGGFDGVTAPSKKVVAFGPASKGPDPWQTYVLECGHHAI
jgi:hypothetical protein